MLVDQKYILKKQFQLVTGWKSHFFPCIYIYVCVCDCVIVCVLQLTINPSKILGASHRQRQEDHTDESQ